MLRKILIGFVVVFVVIQFFRPQKNATLRHQPDDLFVQQSAPQEVRVMIEQGCYDCHSNNTRYPWYAQVQPVAWWLDKHVRDGKEHLNFSEFGKYTAKRAARKLGQCVEQLDDGSMPLPSYTWIHTDARFTAEQKKQLVTWLEATQEKLEPEE
jgi:hypothetical protein